MTADYAKSVMIVRKIMSEPQYLEGDDVALKDECDECGNFIHTCECDTGEPDRMYGDEE
jgi:hypothetical protein